MPTESEASLPKEVKPVRIPEQKVFDGVPFPLVLNPADDYRNKDSDYWKDWVKKNVETLEMLLLKYGAILFRDFSLESPKDFDEFAKAYGYKEFPYLGGVSVREQVVGNVFTSTEAPSGAKIPFHHEMAHVREYPLVLFFYCDVPAKEGGETPILLSNVLYRKMAELEPDLIRRLETEGLRYIRVAPDGTDSSSALGRGWQSTFLTDNKDDAERKAKDAGYDFEWLEDGSMKTITVPLLGVRIDKRTGKKMWFNSIYTVFNAWKDARNDNTKAVVFQNGDTVPFKCLTNLEKVVEEVSVTFSWERKDVVFIDNRAVQHARSTHFVPPRRILASLFTDHHGVLSSIN